MNLTRNMAIAPICLLAAMPMAPVGAAEPHGETAARVVLFADLLPEESDIQVSNSLFDSEIEDADWDDSFRIGIDVGGELMIAEEGGPLFTYGLALAYSRYEVDDDNEEFSGNSLMLTPRAGIGIHAVEWLFLEASAFAGIGMSRFDYDNETFDIDEESDAELAYEYGVMASAAFALGETFVLGARVGWISQHLEGEFDGDGLVGDTEIESDTEGVFYGAFAGLRF